MTAERIRSSVRPLGVEVEVVPLGKMAGRLAAGGVALLHAFHARLTGPSVKRAAEGAGVPFVVTFSGTDVNVDLPEHRGRQVIGEVVSGASGLLVFYPAALRSVAAAFPEALSKIHVAWPGVSALRGQSMRAELGIPEEAVVFTLPSPLRASKRPLYAVPLLEEAHRLDERVHFILAGPVIEDGYGDRVERALEERGWAHYLGCLPPETMGSLYATSDVVMNTAATESLSNAVLEGMAAGLPPLVSDNPGNREALGVLGPGRGYEEPAGLLFASEWSFLEGAKRLVESASLRRNLGEAARRRVEHAFDARREADQHVLLWRRAMEGRPARWTSAL